MEVAISTSEPQNVDPVKVAAALDAAGYFVAVVSVNGEITYTD